MRYFTNVSCCAKVVLSVAWGAVGFTAPAHGQGAAVPTEHGQWAGPYQLALPDVPGAGVGEEYAEIAHAAVLPPPDSQSSMERVVFFARRTEECFPSGPGDPARRADGWLWRPRFPSNVERLPITGSPTDASADPFCSGHTFLPDGSLAVFGGLDVHDAQCSGGCDPTGAGPGHLLTYRLDSSVDPPQWDMGWAVQMGRARWYPTSISMANGDIFVGGHGPTAEPGNVCEPIYQENPGGGAPYQVTYDRTYEILDWGGTPGPAMGPVVTSYLDGLACGSEDQGELARLLAYPRLHLLSNKLLFQADAPMFPFLPPSEFGVRVMDVDPGTILCSDGRWSLQLNLLQPKRNGGNTVHLLYLDDSPQPVLRDVIYAIGGTEGSDEATFDPGGLVHDLVEKVVLIDPNLASWAGSGAGSPPNLNTKRFNHNSVILLDGSILVNGGWHGDPISTPPGTVLNAERYRPPELFDIAEGSSLDVWKPMTSAVEPSHRRYHSVAGLLPDGRVFSAGGQNGQGGIDSEHTVSVYSPSYLFHPRPEITSAPATITNLDNQGVPFLVNVALSSPSASFYRLGLIRNGSVTHAWDMNQRYVELDAAVVSQDGSDVTLQVTPPATGFAAPLGFYLMAVVEENPVPPPPPPAGFYLEQRWIPSPGVWVQVVDGS